MKQREKTTIKFADWCIEAIRKGEKTVTRRKVKIPEGYVYVEDFGKFDNLTAPCIIFEPKELDSFSMPIAQFCPYGLKGHMLEVEGTDIMLFITDVKVKSNFSPGDDEAKAEGLETYADMLNVDRDKVTVEQLYSHMWNSFYGDFDYNNHNLIWVISFEVIEGLEDDK